MLCWLCLDQRGRLREKISCFSLAHVSVYINAEGDEESESESSSVSYDIVVFIAPFDYDEVHGCLLRTVMCDGMPRYK